MSVSISTPQDGADNGQSEAVTYDAAAVTTSAATPSAPAATAELTTGLRVHNLTKSFRKKCVVRGVSYHVQRGETVGLLGPNGAGKTTSFYMTAGLVAPDAGTVWLDEHEMTDLPVYQRARLGIGYLPQEGSIFGGLTVTNNLMSIAEFYYKSRDSRTEVVTRLLSEFGLNHIADSMASSLSGGERRRVEIARSLVHEPQFLLLDEPFAGVDPIAVDAVRVLVRSLNERGIGVLLTDHNVHAALAMLDRVYVVHDGGILAEGTPRDIVANQDVRRLYLGDSFERQHEQ